jgi:putative aldouronate transport system substrate-binding protein
MGLLAQETFVQDADQLKSMVNKSSPDTMIVGAATGFWQGVFVDANILTTGYADYVPVLPLKGPSGLQQMCKTNLGFNLVGAITTACKTPEIAIKWVDYWMSFDGSMITSRGWEGLNYEWVDTPSIDGQAKSYRRITDRDQSQNSFWYVTPINDSLKRRYSEERKEGKSGTVMYDASVAYLPFTKGDGWPSILWPSAEQTAVVSLLEPTILDYVNQSIAEFILGKKSIDNDWESYLNDLKQMGLDDYIKIQKDIVSGKK